MIRNDLPTVDIRESTLYQQLKDGHQISLTIRVPLGYRWLGPDDILFWRFKHYHTPGKLQVIENTRPCANTDELCIAKVIKIALPTR